MSINRTDYIVYGWRLPYKLKDNEGNNIDLYSDKLLPYVEGHEGVNYSIITDGMCGNYNVFGVILNQGGDEDEGWGFEELNLKDVDDEKLNKTFEVLFGKTPEVKAKMFIFSDFH